MAAGSFTGGDELREVREVVEVDPMEAEAVKF